MTKPTFDLNKRPLSWSAISSFEYDPEQWYRRYVLKQEDPASKEMLFGKYYGEMFASDPNHVPHLKRGQIFEYELKAKLKNIPLIGFIDSYTPHTELEEYKTGVKAWTQKRADEHGQIDMYLLMLYLMHGVKPEDVSCRVHWLPTKETGDFRIVFTDPHNPIVHTFETKRTLSQVLKFGVRITKTVEAMRAYAENHD